MIRSKIIFFFGLSVLILSGCSALNKESNKGEIPADVVFNPNTAEGQVDTNLLPKIEFVNELHDFGRIIQGTKVSYSFKFKNSGRSDLLIT
ncbi:MAG: DUF1573 domain-containing protein, partial [Bacteroidales bacterium]|nr:DUF1573 domain-containing protein [Bacteroidales bacterium]